MLNLTTLAERAMTVKLTQRKPKTSTRNVNGEHILADTLGDDANSVSTRLFKDPSNPCRQLLNAHGEIYRNHVKLTWPHVDRGPRLLSVHLHTRYLSEQRALESKVDAATLKFLPDEAAYSMWVNLDIARRTDTRKHLDPAKVAAMPPITAAEYPTFEQFKTGLTSTHVWGTLPSTRHPIFDNTDAELDAVREQIREEIERGEEEIRQRIAADAKERIHAPLVKLLGILRHPIGATDPVTGTRLGIFRDSAVDNVTEAVDLVRAMAMGDNTILTMCDEVAEVFTGHVANPEHLRQSPMVRSEAVRRLDAVAEKMGVFFGGV